MRFGVEPYDTAARLVPIYQKVGELIGEKLGCKVEVFVATSYNAEIEAMRNGKLEIGEFGPLGYVLAHQVAKAEAVAAFGTADGKPNSYWASIVTYPASGIKTVAEIKGHSFAFSDPASTSGHLFPAYGLRKAGLDPDKDIRASAMLRIRGLTMRYPDGKVALADFDLSIEAGELVVVLGGNGSGKTTLLRCISRMLSPTAGEIWLNALSQRGRLSLDTAAPQLAERSWSGAVSLALRLVLVLALLESLYRRRSSSAPDRRI